MTDQTAPETPPEDQNEEISAKQIYRVWAACDRWPLDDALELLANPTPHLPGEPSTYAPAAEALRKMLITREIAVHCLGKSLTSAPNPHRPDEIFIEPESFLEWAASRDLSVPGDLLDIVKTEREQMDKRRRAKATALRPSQIHQHRCSGIARYLWSQPDTKDLNIEQMLDQDAIWNFGCQGNEYARGTVRRWIKDETEHHRPGRPSKAKA